MTFRTAIIVFAVVEGFVLACFVAYVLLRH
jgi:hypothetical protein